MYGVFDEYYKWKKFCLFSTTYHKPLISNKTISFTFEKNCGRLVYQLINGVSYMTIKSQIQEMVQMLAENGVRIDLSDNKRSDEDTMKLLNKVFREMVA